MTAPRILVMEDDTAVRSIVARVLTGAGYEVTEAGDGVEGVSALGHGLPDLVVTDINMPNMDGIEVIRLLRGQHPELPIIAISGGGLLPKDLLLKSARALGAILVLPKPFDAATLLDAVGRVLDGR